MSLMYSVATYISNSVLHYNINLQQFKKFVVPRIFQVGAFVTKL